MPRGIHRYHRACHRGSSDGRFTWSTASTRKPTSRTGPSDTRRTLLVLLITLLVLIPCAVWRAMGDDFVRPALLDEFITLQNYTWAGVHEDGTRRVLRPWERAEALDAVTPQRFMVGVYAAMGRWPEPNNHIPHSLFVNGSLLTGGSTLFALRVPALIAAGLFGLALAHLCCLLRWHVAAPLVALLAFWQPYVVEFSQQSRGYALMLLLAACTVALLIRLARSPRSIFWATLLTLAAFLSFQNIISMSADWVMPVYLVGLILPGLFVARDAPVEDRHALRKSLFIQSLVIVFVGLVFLADRLPYVYSAARQYGVPVNSWAQFTAWAGDLIQLMAPTLAAKIALGLGVVGAIVGLFDRDARMALAPALAAVAFTGLHYIAGGKAGYPRNAGYLLIPLLLGYGFVLHRLVLATPGRWRVLAAILLTACTAGLAAPAAWQRITDLDHKRMVEFVGRLPADPRTTVFPLLGPSVSRTLVPHFPAHWQPLTTLPHHDVDQAQLTLCQRTHLPFTIDSPQPGSASWHPTDWPGATRAPAAETYEMIELPCRLRVSDGMIGQPGPSIALWYPPFDLVAVGDEAALGPVAETGLPFHALYIRYQAKLEVFSRPACIVIPLPAGASDQVDQLRQVIARLGGQVALLLPR
jgi:hypothetical protein